MSCYLSLQMGALAQLRGARRFLQSLRLVMALASVMAVVSACQSPLDPRFEAIVRGPGHVEETSGRTARTEEDDGEAEDEDEPKPKRGERAEK